MYRYGNVTQHGFWTGSRNDDFTNLIECWVGDAPQLPFFCSVLHFDISKAGLVCCTIVYDAFTSVYQAVIP